MTTKIRQSTQLLPETVVFTTTGNIDDLDFGNAPVILMNNATLATIRGLKAGVDGQEVTIISKGAGEVDCAHQNTNSAAANRLINFATSAATPLAAGVGTITYEYDATTQRWRLKSHFQGAVIAFPYASVVYSAAGGGSVTVDSGDQSTYTYELKGNYLFVDITLNTISITGVVSQVYMTLPGGFTIATSKQQVGLLGDNSTAFVTLLMFVLTGEALIKTQRLDGANWQVSTNGTYIRISANIAVN